jgi:hypothetical protein
MAFLLFCVRVQQCKARSDPNPETTFDDERMEV